MQLRNTVESYGWVSIAIHWLMALVIIAMFALGVYMVELTYVDVWYKAAPHWHQSVGMLLLLLLIFRLVWRMTNPLPKLLGQPFEQMIALFVHRMHYVFMFSLMVSGYVMATADGRGIEVFNWFEVQAIFPTGKGREEVFGFVHMILAWAFMAFVGLHASAALKHHFVDKDVTLLRMLGMKKESNHE